jgi:STE24 endopeptidase
LEENILTPEEVKKARRYQMRRLWLGLAGSLVEFAAVFAFLLWVPRGWWPLPWGSVFLAGAIYFAALVTLRQVITLPMDFYAGYLLPHEVGLSTETPGGWLIDQVKGLALLLVLGGAAAGGFVFIMAGWPGEWWWIAALLGTLLSALLALIAPIFLAPLFFKFKPLSDKELLARLEALLTRTGARVRGGVWEMDTSRRTRAANAALVGLGPSRRVVLSDTLMDYGADEIEAILAHEIAHHVGHHIWLLLAGRGVLLAAGMFMAQWVLDSAAFSGWTGLAPIMPGDVRAIAAVWLLMSIWGAVASPFILAFSRRLEYGCDRYAVSFSSHGEAMASALAKLGKKNLADPDPPRWVVALFHSHPSIRSRIRRVRDAVRANG